MDVQREISKNDLQIAFNDIQRCDTKKFYEYLNTIKNVPFDNFRDILCSILNSKKSNAKIILFFKRLIEELNDSNFIDQLFEMLMRTLSSKATRVRKNTLILLKIINDIPKYKSKITFKVLEQVSEKLFDKEKTVRKEALIFLCEYQDVDLHENTKIMNLYKNIVRYDPSNEIRKVALSCLFVEPSTYNCMIERIVDINLGIRSIFYNKCINDIKIKDLEKDTKIFLLRKVFSERELDAKAIFVDVIIQNYSLPAEFTLLCDSFYDHRYLKYLEILLKSLFDLYDVKIVGLSNDLISESEFTISFDNNFYFTLTYYKYIEDNKGKDFLNLPDLNLFVEYLYNYTINYCENISKQERALTKEESDTSTLDNIKNLFKILRLYDTFDDESRKLLFSTVHKLLSNVRIDFIIEESISLLFEIDSSYCDKIFGTIIKKNIYAKNLINKSYSCMIGKFVMKYCKRIESFQEAILKELVLNDEEVMDFLKQGSSDNTYSTSIITSAIEIIFFYLLHTYNEEVFEIFTTFKNNRFLEMLVDLTLVYKNREDSFFKTFTLNYISSTTLEAKQIIPLSKLILSNVMESTSFISKYISFCLRFYYSTEDEKVIQYLNVFFHEYFPDNCIYLLDNFCHVFDSLENNTKIFVDQSLWFTENSKNTGDSQTLFYNICVHLFLYKDELINQRAYISILNRIDICKTWESVLTKKILFCCTMILKNSKSKKTFSEIINKIMLIDDGEPISRSDLLDVKGDMLLL